MAGSTGFSNALGWAHFRLRGASRNLAVTTVAYLTIIGGLILLTVRTDPRSTRSILEFWTYALLVLQFGTIGLYACAAIRSAIRKDVTSGMMESHRLMPVSGTEAVFGYLLGATSQAMSIALANLLLGMLTSAWARLSPADWLWANALMAVFSLWAWAVIALLSFLTQAAVGVLIILLILGATTGGAAISLFPGIIVLLGPSVGQTIGMARSGLRWDYALQVSLSAQFIVALFCFIGAARKFRRDDVLAFGPLLGLGLVLIWVTLSAIGIVRANEFRSGLFPANYTPRHIRLIASVISTVLVATIPVNASAWLSAEHHRRRLLQDPAVGRRPLPSLLVILAASVIAVLLPAIVTYSRGNPQFRVWVESLLRTGISVAATLAAIGYLLRILYRVTTKPTLAIGIWVFATWVGPLVLDFLRFSAMGMRHDDDVLTAISGCSPVGSPTLLWGGFEVSTDIGLFVQLAYAAILAFLFHSSQKRQSVPEARAASLKLDVRP